MDFTSYSGKKHERGRKIEQSAKDNRSRSKTPDFIKNNAELYEQKMPLIKRWKQEKKR